jgi:hypothetical protein
MQTKADAEGADNERPPEDLLEEMQERIRRRLSPGRWRRFWGSDPELIKVLGQTHSQLSEISRLLSHRKSGHVPRTKDVEHQLTAMLKEDITKFNINAAWEFSDSLRRLLLQLGDDRYILAHLKNEQAGRADENPELKWEIFLEEQPEQKNDSHNHARKKKMLDKLVSDYQEGRLTDALQAQTVEYLALIYSSRSRVGRFDRAARDTRDRYLTTLYRTLLFLLALLSLGIFFASNQNFGLCSPHNSGDCSPLNFPIAYVNSPYVRCFFIAALAGAMGSVLSGYIKLRDDVADAWRLRYNRAARWAQPFVGATIGVLFYLVLASDLLGISIKNAGTGGSLIEAWRLLAIYCFIAGYSEPFFLRTVERVGGKVDKKGENQIAASAKTEKPDDKKLPETLEPSHST